MRTSFIWCIKDIHEMHSENGSDLYKFFFQNMVILLEFNFAFIVKILLFNVIKCTDQSTSKRSTSIKK